ncbi:MAG: HEAT repeat domain-containing protein [Anaerolineae bacterium]|nr:HEAT repeat domain-containing protein [Anaerolineae bacterium]MDQ7033743.1 HEAT repeat domain-containing protein [Anaerolineae bacterium]
MTNEYKPDIWQLQSQFNIQGLIRALGSDDKNIRKRAAAALRTMNAKESLSALKVAFTAEEDTNTRMVIATAIEILSIDSEKEEKPARIATSALSGASLVERLSKRLYSDKSEIIAKTAQQLGDLGDKSAVEPLILLFSDHTKTIEVRLAVAEALLKLEAAPVEVALLGNLRHADWHIRRNGAAILGQLKAEWAILPLARALNDAHPVVRRTARAALKHIGTPASRKALAQAGANKAVSRHTPDAPATTASGITIKKPSQKPKKQASRMLNKHLDEASEVRTKRIDAGFDETKKKHVDPTMPISADVLDQLAALDEDDEDDNN